MFANNLILNRYELTEDKHIIIDISVQAIKDLYYNLPEARSGLRLYQSFR
jgi:hypothetical protein